jgi:DNA transposition AAA+ family ATPase
MRTTICETAQDRAALRKIAQLRLLSTSERRLGLIEGPSGTGKTTLSKLIAERYASDAAIVRLGALDGTRSMLAKVLHATVGWHTVEGTKRAAYDRALSELKQKPDLILVIDEADKLVGGPDRDEKLEVVRDLADESGCAIVLLSVKALARWLRRTDAYSETLTTRLAFHFQFQRPTVQDAQLLADQLIEGVELEPDLVEHCLTAARGSYRPLLDLYTAIERLAGVAGVHHMNLAKWNELRSVAVADRPVAPPKPVASIGAVG